jgi:single-stranded-DNA-specific exonuclease
MAAGLTLRGDHFTTFAEAFEAVGRSWLTEAQLERVVETDGPLEDDFYSTQFIELLDGQVWGQGFAPPVFCDEFRVVSQRILKDRHLKLLLERNGRRYDAIWFGHTDALGDRARVAFRLDANEYNGVTKVQLLVEHAEPA